MWDDVIVCFLKFIQWDGVSSAIGAGIGGYIAYKIAQKESESARKFEISKTRKKELGSFLSKLKAVDVALHDARLTIPLEMKYAVEKNASGLDGAVIRSKEQANTLKTTVIELEAYVDFLNILSSFDSGTFADMKIQKLIDNATIIEVNVELIEGMTGRFRNISKMTDEEFVDIITITQTTINSSIEISEYMRTTIESLKDKARG